MPSHPAGQPVATPAGGPGRQPLTRFRHIAIEGPIGVGKTTLARRLATHLGADLLLEQPHENPFLERFYADMPGYALQTQLAFLFQRVRQMQGLAQAGMFAPTVVSDFMFEKDAIFARLTLDDDEYRLYRTMYDQVAPQLVPPDLIVWLRASPTMLVERIRGRAIAMEQQIGIDYLDRLAAAYVAWFLQHPALPMVAVDTARFDPGRDDADFARLVDRLERHAGRHELIPADGVPPFI